MHSKSVYKSFSFLLIFLSFLSFFLGFYFNENSSGGGLFTGDWKFAWKNLQLFLNNDLATAINHEDFASNRTPLLYILHKLFNPFANSELGYRRSVFFISLLGPILFYFCLKQKYKTNDNLLLILISSIIFLSPYYRTSAFWGLEENYGIISILLAYLFLNYFMDNEDKNGAKIYIQLFLAIFFSSVCIYFDQKLLIISIISFISIMLSKKMSKFKILTIIFFSIFALPYIYLIKIWGTIVPTPQSATKFNVEHIGYALSIIAFYITPFLFFKKNNIFNDFKSFLFNKKNNYLIILFIFYLLFLFGISYFKDINILNTSASLGKGIIHKISIIIFDTNIYRELFIYFSFLASWIIVLLFIDKGFKDSLILLYFVILALMTKWILQEYFDPLLLLMIFLYFGVKLILNYKNSFILYLYYSVFLISSNIYYYQILN